MLKIFGTDGIRCRVNQEPMTTDTCLKIAKAAGYLLSNKTQKKNIVIMGGAYRVQGNVTPWAEANIYGDPEAANLVFNSGICCDEHENPLRGNCIP